MKPFELSGFGFARRVGSETNPETGHLCPGRLIFPGGRGFHGHRQADLELACQARCAEAIARLDQIVATYPSLALFSVPVIMLEPVKPVAAYLAATGQMVSSVVTLIVGELLKLVLVERLFSLTRDKLMKIPAFVWAYTKFREAKAWLEATEAWQAIRAISKAARQYLTEMKKSAAVAFRQS